MNSFWLEYNQNGDVQEFTFDGSSVTIGRDRSSDFVLDHPTVSRQHAVIRKEGPGRFILRVLSRGGLTAIDGQQAQGEVPLHDGANINLGKITFRFRSDEAPSQPRHNLGGGESQQQPPSSGGPAGSGNMGGAGGAENRGGSGDTGAQSGFGQSLGGQGSSSGFGPQQNQNSNPGGFAQSSQGFQSGGMAGQGGQQPAGGQPKGDGQDGSIGDETPEGEGPDIVSWDEIASSEEAMNEEEVNAREKSVFERMEEGQKKQEETRPGVIIVAGLAIVGLMSYIFLGDLTDGGGGGGGEGELTGSKELKVEVECLGKADCVKKAKSAYMVGNEKLKKSGAAISNRFEGYKSLLEAEKYLEEAGATDPPPSLSDLPERQAAAKKDLEKLFRNFRVAYHQAKSSKNYTRMAESLSTIKSYFPDKKSYEHRWALAKERAMKQKGLYPSKTF